MFTGSLRKFWEFRSGGGVTFCWSISGHPRGGQEENSFRGGRGSGHFKGSISAALSRPVFVPPRVRGGVRAPVPEQRLLFYETTHFDFHLAML